MSLKTKALIIGFGSIGKKHFKALKELGFEMAVLSKSASEKDFSEFGEFELFQSFDECDLNKIDYFVIANITSLHFDTLKELNSRVQGKKILVEKPLFDTQKELNLQNKIFVAYLLRFSPLVKELKKRSKELEIYQANLSCKSFLPSWRKLDYRTNYSAKKELGGGVLLDLSHELDLAFFLFGKLNLAYAKNAKISELEISSDDLAFLALEKKGLFVSINLNYFSKFDERVIELHSKTCSLRADLLKNELEIYGKVYEKLSFQSDTILHLKAMHEAVLNEEAEICDYKQGLELLRLCDEIRKKNE